MSGRARTPPEVKRREGLTNNDDPETEEEVARRHDRRTLAAPMWPRPAGPDARPTRSRSSQLPTNPNSCRSGPGQPAYIRRIIVEEASGRPPPRPKNDSADGEQERRHARRTNEGTLQGALPYQEPAPQERGGSPRISPAGCRRLKSSLFREGERDAGGETGRQGAFEPGRGRLFVSRGACGAHIRALTPSEGRAGAAR